MGLFGKNKVNKQKELELQKKEEALNYKAELLDVQESNLEIAKHEFEETKKQISEKLNSREKYIDDKEIELLGIYSRVLYGTKAFVQCNE